MTVQEAGSAVTAGGAPVSQPIQWYVGRDGQQYGPVGDIEFRAMLASGQILPTDLVWRDGFGEWIAAATVRAQQATAQSAPTGPTQHQASTTAVAPVAASAAAATSSQPYGRRAKSRQGAGGEKKLGRRVRKLGRVIAWSAIGVFFAVTLAAAYLVVAGDKTLLRMATALIPQFGERIPTSAPITGFATTTDATDQALQKTRLGQVLKKYHPVWYGERVKEATDGVRAGKSEAELVGLLMLAVTKLRREYAGDAASAPVARLKSIASLFATNLVKLKAHSVDACFQYVSAGEGAPVIAALFQNVELTSALQAQLAATFEGIDEGRRTPRVYPQPKASDYDVLVTALKARGWSDDDLVLFADSQKLSLAKPETVCRLVTEWFDSQLAIREPDVQLRLLVDSLRPVVAG